MKWKSNILNKFWFSPLLVTVLFFISKYIWDNEVDSYVYSWLMVFVISMVFQTLIPQGGRKKIVHLLFIVLVVITSMFSVHIMNRALTIDINGLSIFHGIWFDYLITSLVESAILLGFKLIFWIVLKVNHNRIDKLIEGKTTLTKQNEMLSAENEELKEKLKENRDLNQDK